MQVADLHRLSAELEEPVLKGHGQEESLVITSEVGQYFYHPIYHASSESWRYLMPPQTVCHVIFTFLLKIPEISVNVIIQLMSDIDILPLNITRKFALHRP